MSSRSPLAATGAEATSVCARGGATNPLRARGDFNASFLETKPLRLVVEPALFDFALPFDDALPFAGTVALGISGRATLPVMSVGGTPVSTAQV